MSWQGIGFGLRDVIAAKAHVAVSPPWHISSVRRFGVIYQESAKRSLYQPHILSSPPFSVMAFQ